jgi:nitrous oxidase accessory protein NosD
VFDPVISDNLISGGAGDQDFASADGISLFWSFGAVISKNVVSGFRNGLAAQFFSGASVTGNEFVENGIGAGLAFADDSYAWNVIDGNVMSGNAIYGLSTTAIAYSHITNNDMHDNGSDPENDGGVLLVNSSVNLIAMNEVNRNTGFGIVIDGHFINEEIPDFAVLNTVQHNDVKFNGGAGIVLLNKAHDNLIEFNDAFKNSVGIVAGFESPFPFGNTFDSNTIERNSEYDVLDLDPSCNVTWIANEFGSVGSIPGGCFE